MLADQIDHERARLEEAEQLRAEREVEYRRLLDELASEGDVVVTDAARWEIRQLLATDTPGGTAPARIARIVEALESAGISRGDPAIRAMLERLIASLDSQDGTHISRIYELLGDTDQLPVPAWWPRRHSASQLIDQPLGIEDAQAVAPTAEQTIEHTLARMFMRLGPPPEPTELDYEPAGSGGGGAQQ